jgi:hypothetical protein
MPKIAMTFQILLYFFITLQTSPITHNPSLPTSSKHFLLKKNQNIQTTYTRRNFLSNFLSTIQRTWKQRFKVRDETVKIGEVGDQLYTGKWTSNKSSQNNFIHSQEGKFKLLLTSETENSLHLQIIFYEQQFIDSFNISSEESFRVDSSQQNTFTKAADIFIEKNTHFYFNSSIAYCSTEFLISLKNKSTDDPVPIQSNDPANTLVSGRIFSEKCKLDLTFETEMFILNHKEAITITVLSILFQMACVLAIIRIIRKNNNNAFLIINDWIIGFHVALDFGLFYFNLFFGTSYQPGYALYLMIIGFVHFVSSFIKNFLFGKQFAAYIAQGRFTPKQRKCLRMWFFLKILIVIGIGISFSLLFFKYPVFYYVLFIYPVIQIIHNCKGISRKHIFIWWLHCPLFLSYIFFFCYLKGFNSFFELSYSHWFTIIICSQVLIFMLIMIFQRIFGPLFFLPNSLKPGYYNYYRKFSKHPVDPEATCSICLTNVIDHPEQESGGNKTFFIYFVYV